MSRKIFLGRTPLRSTCIWPPAPSRHSFASVAINYSLTPRTQVGVNMSSSRGFSPIEDAYASYASAISSAGKWAGIGSCGELHGGGGFITPIRSHYAILAAAPCRDSGGEIWATEIVCPHLPGFSRSAH